MRPWSIVSRDAPCNRRVHVAARPRHMQWKADSNGVMKLRVLEDDSIVSQETLMRFGCRDKEEIVAKVLNSLRASATRTVVLQLLAGRFCV
jgi:hypothetical protein